MSRVGVFVEVNEMYHKINRKFHGAKLNYEIYVQHIKEKFGNILRAYAYGMQVKHEALGFITCLRQHGFLTKFKSPKIIKVGDNEIRQCDWSCIILLDIIYLLDNLDIIILGTSNPLFIPIVCYLKSRGKKVIIFAPLASKKLQRIADEVIDIDESFLEKEK